MKKVILLGRLASNIPDAETGVTSRNFKIFSSSSLNDVKSIFQEQKNEIDCVIMGAGIDLEVRIEAIRFIFETSKSTTVHLKDWNSGSQGMLPFVNGILTGLVNT